MDQRRFFPNARILLGLADEIVIKIQRCSHMHQYRRMMHTPALTLILLPPIIAALAAGLLNQIQALNLNGFVERLGHIVDRQRGDGRGRERPESGRELRQLDAAG